MKEDLTNGNPQETENQADNIAAEATNNQTNKEENASETCDADNLATELAELKDSHLRLMAEYENYRKRSMKEKAELIKNGGEKVLIGLLPVLDDFERALQTVSEATDAEAVAEGINLIYNKFVSFLNQNGVKPIPAVNEPFNEDLFDAIAIIPSANAEQKGKVVECVQTGYSLNDKIIRHAKVVVAE